jgi:hypothetical protein
MEPTEPETTRLTPRGSRHNLSKTLRDIDYKSVGISQGDDSTESVQYNAPSWQENKQTERIARANDNGNARDWGQGSNYNSNEVSRQIDNGAGRKTSSMAAMPAQGAGVNACNNKQFTG